MGKCIILSRYVDYRKYYSLSELSGVSGFGQQIWEEGPGLRFYVDDAEAVPLGNYKGTTKTGFAVKSFPEWNSLFVGAPLLPPEVLQNIARFAGVNVYNENTDDTTLASGNLLLISSIYGGERKLQFPKACSVYDLYRNQKVAQKVREVTVSLPPRSTTFYYFGSDEEYAMLCKSVGK